MATFTHRGKPIRIHGTSYRSFFGWWQRDFRGGKGQLYGLLRDVIRHVRVDVVPDEVPFDYAVDLGRNVVNTCRVWRARSGELLLRVPAGLWEHERARCRARLAELMGKRSVCYVVGNNFLHLADGPLPRAVQERAAALPPTPLFRHGGDGFTTYEVAVVEDTR